MVNSILLTVGFSVILSEVGMQTLDNLISPSPEVIQSPKPSSSSATDLKWEELKQVLQSLKCNSKIKKERLYNIVKIIKLLLSDEIEKKNEDKKVIEEIKEKIEEPEDEMFPCPTMPDYDNIVDERLNKIKEIIDDKTYMLDTPVENNKTEINVTPTPKNKTADFSKIFSKKATALAKLKEKHQEMETETEIPKLMPIFRTKTGCKNDFNPILYENPKQLGNLVSGQTVMNPMPSQSMFSIPCQRASDILEETSSFPLPKDAFCNNPAANLKSLAKNAKLNLDNLPFDNIVPNSVTCVDSDDSIAMLFKPKTITLMQVYGDLLKKLTVTVLVPYYVSTLDF